MNEHDYQQRILELEKQNTKLASRNHYLKELFRLAQHKQFGKCSEGHSGQGELFNEVEEILAVVAEPETETITYTRGKANALNYLPIYQESV
jgi:hypothetical protein